MKKSERSKSGARAKAEAPDEQLFTVRLNLAIWRALNIAAIAQHRPAAAMARDAIREYLKALRCGRANWVAPWSGWAPWLLASPRSRRPAAGPTVGTAGCGRLPVALASEKWIVR